MAKEKNYNPVNAQRKADKAKAIKKGEPSPAKMRQTVARKLLQESRRLKNVAMSDSRRRTPIKYKNKSTT